MSSLDPQLDAIDERTLEPVVREAMGRERITVEDWSYSPLTHGVINPVTAGLYLFSGTAFDGAERLRWSAVLKVIHWVDMTGTPLADGYMDEPGDWNYWKREALVFQSGILDAWQGDLVAVRCYQVVEQPDDSVWLWLEHVREPPGRTWPLERHILAARHFGQFNGAYCRHGPVPEYDWLCRNFMRQWGKTGRAFNTAGMVADSAFWELPEVRHVFPTPVADRVVSLLDEADRLLDRLERQPQTLSHLDTQCVNLFARQGEQGQDQTVVIDWSFLGEAAVGEDLGMQVSGNLFDLSIQPASARSYYEAALEAYVAGLRDAGWRGSPDAVRFASATAASLRLVPFGMVMLGGLFDTAEEASWGDHLAEQQASTAEEALRLWGQAITFLLDLADEARQLADRV